MATCPRCLGTLTDGHKCRPIWIRRLKRQISFTVVGAAFGSLVQVLIQPAVVPVLGVVLGGLVFFVLHEAFKADVQG